MRPIALSSAFVAAVLLFPGAARAEAEAGDGNGWSPLSVLDEGAPTIGDPKGWSVTPHGRLQVDVGGVEARSSIDAGPGFDSEYRRARLGLEATAPGGFSLRVDTEFSEHVDEVMDAYVAYSHGPLQITLGQQNTFQTLEELTSSLSASFIERSALTDAFGFQRRVGLSAQYQSGIILLQGGAFLDNLRELDDRGRSVDGRVVAMPKLGGVQLHFGATLHYAWYEDGATQRYRQRPLIHLSDRRFIDTGSFSGEGERGNGLEFAAISGPLHATAEAYWQHVDRAGFADPTFFGGYAEVGLFLTPGDSTAYSRGVFGRVRPKRPVTSGGPGAVQLNFRYDYLDLTDAGIRGGEQNGYMASLVWTPTAHTRLMADFARLQYSGARQRTVDGRTAYGIDSFAVRAQIDF
ncbi:conserved hypothetical protein [Altererythrobacter sp. B11]|uniref:OprO/OprP family phosphate-selective porin n=1 Tax=Altererythrobacter sp. B11 TaxID=2060312 RepID=UPI000DC73A6F|nr:porin [Altererythrobacter sp. B11]BBC72694.1 conserved hypothetical protein [Altererythrobacter sp. B11]